jgi:5-methylcytosine-specific restriction endonuclease McrA
MDPDARAGRPVGERYQAIVHIDGDQAASASLHLGPLLPDSVRRYLTCDCTIRTVIEKHGRPIFVNERLQTVDPKLRALIEHRDQGCRVPGCGARHWLHIHHIIHREDGGLTIVANLVALCPAHHRMHHAGQLGIRGDPNDLDGLIFTDSHDRPIRGPSPRSPVAPSGDWPLPEPRWRNPYGARLDSHWISWN